MIRCKDCRHWAKIEASDYHGDVESEIRGFCDSPKFIQGYGRRHIDDDGVAVGEDEGWAFRTGPEFGCIHAEQKS